MPSAPSATEAHATIFDHAAYWLSLVGVYLLAGFLFFYSGKSKLIDDDGKAPAAIKQQFRGTFVDTFPGIDFLWWTIGILEFTIFALMAVSVLTGEFLPRRPKRFLLVSLTLAFFTYACLSFGQTTTGNLAGTASLYSYFGSTVVIFLLVFLLPPNSPPNWLSARLASRNG